MEQEIDHLNYDEIRKQGMIYDLWLDKSPSDPYELCPCGCEKKMRFAEKEGIQKHIDNFSKKYFMH